MPVRVRLLTAATILIVLAACMPAEPPTPTFYEIMPLPDTAEPTLTPVPDVTVTLAATPVSGNAPDLIAYVRTSVAPPTCFDQHSRAGAYVTVMNQGPGDAGAFMVDVDGVRQSMPEGLKAGENIALWFDASSFAAPWSTMRVTVDPVNQVYETDEVNNFVTAFVATLTPPLPCPTATDPATGSAPDLVGSVYVSLAPPICLGDHSREGALVYVQNIGTGDAGPFMVDVEGTLLAVPEGLAVGDTKILWFDLVSFLPPGETLTVTVDMLAQVAESDEGNNITTAMVLELTPPLPCPTPTAPEGQ